MKLDTKDEVIIYTDGGCEPNPGFGSYGYLIINNTSIFGRANFYELGNTTNNRMEILALIEALRELKKNNLHKKKEVIVYVDSEYVAKGITTWIHKWLKNNFNKGKIKNSDLWLQLWAEASSTDNLELRTILGHNGTICNEIVDSLCKIAIETSSNQIYKLRNINNSINYKPEFTGRYGFCSEINKEIKNEQFYLNIETKNKRTSFKNYLSSEEAKDKINDFLVKKNSLLYKT